MCGRKSGNDDGFTLIEILLVIVVLGILATVVVLSIGGVRSEAEDAVCATDRRQLATAAQAYLVETDTEVIPDAGGPDAYEQTLVNAGYLSDVSPHHDLTPEGRTVPEVGLGC